MGRLVVVDGTQVGLAFQLVSQGVADQVVFHVVACRLDQEGLVDFHGGWDLVAGLA